MSQILHGLSDHQGHAPLSGGDTIAICRYLHGLSEDAFKRIADLHVQLDKKEDGLQKIVNDLAITNASVKDLREDLKALGTRLETVGREATDGLALGEKLKAALKTVREDVGHLREGQKLTNNNVHSVREDLQARSADIKGLRAEVDNVLKAQIKTLEEKLNASALSLKQVTHEHEKSKKELSSHKEKLRSLAEDAKVAREDFKNLGATVSQQGATLADTSAKAEETKTNLEITNAVVLKISQGNEAAAQDIIGLRDGLRAAGMRMDGLQAEGAKTAKGLSSAREELKNAVAAIDQNRMGLRQAQEHAQLLHQGQAKAAASLDRLGGDLARVKGLADSTQQHLEVTNSMVLPNLGVGDVPPLGFHSSMDTSRSLGKPAPPQSSPRKRREATWVARNIGAVPDRMSWI